MSLFRAALIVFGVLMVGIVLAAILAPVPAPPSAAADSNQAANEQAAVVSPDPAQQSAPLDLSKPVHTLANAIICPLDTFISPLASNSRDKLEAMFDDQGGDRDVQADMHECDMWQPGIAVLPVTPDDYDEPPVAALLQYDNTRALLHDPHYVVLRDLSGPEEEFKVTRADELTN